MKNIFLIVITLFSSLFFSQQIYPLTTNVSEVPNGSYIKDLDGEYNLYIGLWKGNWDGKIIYLKFKIVKDSSLGNHFYYKDRLFGERKIVESNGSISVDRISNFDDNKYHEFSGINKKFSDPSQKQLYFSPNNMCGKTANMDITFLDAAKTQMSLHLIYNPSTIDDSCPHYNSVMQGNDFPINFPKDIVLLKQ